MSPPGVAALYGVVTFALLGAALALLLHATLGWPLVPDTDRLQGQVLLGGYLLFGAYAHKVGLQGARGATLPQAWRAGAGDLGRAIAGLFAR